MKLINAALLAVAGLAVLTIARPQDDNTGTTDLSNGSGDSGNTNLMDPDNSQSVEGTHDGTNTTDESAGDDNQNSGILAYFQSKGPFGGWPGFSPGGQGDQDSSQMRARSFRFGNGGHTGIHRRGLEGLKGY